MQESFDELYTRYAANLLKKHDFETAIYTRIRENIEFYGMGTWLKEDIDDCISILYQRVSRAINVYQNGGASFETYINAVIRMTVKEYQVGQFRSYVEESAAWITQIPEMYACESEAWYDEHFTNKDFYDKPETEDMKKLRNPRQLLILILKCCNHVSADFIERVASRLDIDSATLNEMIFHLREYRKKNEADIITVRERVNRQFYRCILFEKKLQNLAEDSEAFLRIKKQLEKEQVRLRKSRKRLFGLRLDPSNGEIAQLLGISKGTVDSVLHALRKRHQNNPE